MLLLARLRRALLFGTYVGQTPTKGKGQPAALHCYGRVASVSMQRRATKEEGATTLLRVPRFRANAEYCLLPRRGRAPLRAGFVCEDSIGDSHVRRAILHFFECEQFQLSFHLHSAFRVERCWANSAAYLCGSTSRCFSCRGLERTGNAPLEIKYRILL